MTPQEFIAKWQRASLSERSAYQQHFLDLCDVLGQPKPAAADPVSAGVGTPADSPALDADGQARQHRH
jgi:hypothetical protein